MGSVLTGPNADLILLYVFMGDRDRQRQTKTERQTNRQREIERRFSPVQDMCTLQFWGLEVDLRITLTFFAVSCPPETY